VPFHVETRRSLQRARVFNLDADELRWRVLEPWAHGSPIELGGQEWDPRDSTLTVLEGPALEPPDLAHGQGWHRALRSARDVTRDALRATTPAVAVAVLADTPAARRVATAALAELGLEATDWAAVRARLLAGEPAGDHVAAALLIVDGQPPAPSWVLDAGLAVGALGRRAIVARLGGQPPPPELGALGVLALDAEADDAAHALAERARAALSPTPRSAPARGS
jgi:hypothetical protein